VTDDEWSRRGFLELSGSALAAAGLSDTVSAQITSDEDDVADDEFAHHALLLGPADARPDPAGEYISQWDTYRFVYFATDTGEKAHLSTGDTAWTTLPMSVPTTQVDEVRTENFTSFFNLTFARPEAPDDKNWNYTPADVTKQGSEVELAATTTLESTQRGNYPAGSEAIPGVAMRLTATPSAGSGQAGYYNADDGGGAGEDSQDSYVFMRHDGAEKKVYRTNWNGYQPSSRVWVGNRPVITRFPHLFYGGGDFEVRALIHGDTGSELKTLHTFTPESVDDTFGDGPPFTQPNLPITFESSSLTGGSLRANAAHYEFGEVETENRVNGEHFTGVDAGTSGWTPLLIWQKRTGWDMVNVQPLKLSVTATSNDAKLALQLNPTLSSTTTRLPTNSSSDETAVEIVDSFSFDAVGERRWPGYVTAGQGNQPSSVSSEDLTFNLPSDQPVALVAQGVGGTATLSGVVAWEEFF
jgi:hypothetical protein